MPRGSVTTRRTGRLLFPLIAVLLLAPWPIAYAYDNGPAQQDAVRIEVAEASAAPSWQVFGRAIGGLTPGDLFYVDAASNPSDITVNLCLTNAYELIHCYRYLTLKVGVYVETSAGEWGKASGQDGQPIPDTYITLQNGQVIFFLTGYAKYKVTIDDGCFYCTTTNADGGSISPQFYLTAE